MYEMAGEIYKTMFLYLDYTTLGSDTGVSHVASNGCLHEYFTEVTQEVHPLYLSKLVPEWCHILQLRLFSFFSFVKYI